MDYMHEKRKKKKKNFVSKGSFYRSEEPGLYHHHMNEKTTVDVANDADKALLKLTKSHFRW